LLDLEKQYWDAMINKDVRKATRLSADPCIVVGAQGVSSLDRKTMGRMTQDDSWKLDRFEIDEKSLQMQMIDPDVIALAYKVTEHMVVEGKPLTLQANDASVWTRHNGQWTCAMHTESIIGDPFGRDRGM
jgi:hypothetical protein